MGVAVGTQPVGMETVKYPGLGFGEVYSGAGELE